MLNVLAFLNSANGSCIVPIIDELVIVRILYPATFHLVYSYPLLYQSWIEKLHHLLFVWELTLTDFKVRYQSA